MDKKKKLNSNIKLGGLEDSNRKAVAGFGKDNKLAKVGQFGNEKMVHEKVEDSNRKAADGYGKDNKIVKLGQFGNDMMVHEKGYSTNNNAKITQKISELMKMKTDELKAAIHDKGGKPGKFRNKHDLVLKLLKLL